MKTHTDPNEGTVTLSHDPVHDDHIEVLEIYEPPTVTLHQSHITHTWDYLVSEPRNFDDIKLGSRQQRYAGSQTILRHAIQEISLRPYLPEDFCDDDYAEGKWAVTLETANNSWRFLQKDHRDAIMLYNHLHNYITS